MLVSYRSRICHRLVYNLNVHLHSVFIVKKKCLYKIGLLLKRMFYMLNVLNVKHVIYNYVKRTIKFISILKLAKHRFIVDITI